MTPRRYDPYRFKIARPTRLSLRRSWCAGPTAYVPHKRTLARPLRGKALDRSSATADQIHQSEYDEGGEEVFGGAHVAFMKFVVQIQVQGGANISRARFAPYTVPGPAQEAPDLTFARSCAHLSALHSAISSVRSRNLLDVSLIIAWTAKVASGLSDGIAALSATTAGRPKLISMLPASGDAR